MSRNRWQSAHWWPFCSMCYERSQWRSRCFKIAGDFALPFVSRGIRCVHSGNLTKPPCSPYFANKFSTPPVWKSREISAMICSSQFAMIRLREAHSVFHRQRILFPSRINPRLASKLQFSPRPVPKSNDISAQPDVYE